ncbi:ras-related protein Rab-37-like [Silurus meridionalis]|nr:ras-related protein Rab-37-like [Silurus meridionalis]
MSRKKAQKGKSGCASPSTAKDNNNRSGKSGLVTGVQANGVVHPSRASVSSSEFYDVAFKVMLVGDSGVGKTCLLVRFKDGAFLAGSFISTVGIDFRLMSLCSLDSGKTRYGSRTKSENQKNKVLDIDGVKVKLQIWDTAGQERFRSVTHAYYRDAHALLLLYDVTNKASFDNIRAWLTEIHEYAQQDVVLMILGSKEFGVPFMETSARSGLNVDLAFTAIAKELKHRSMKGDDEPKFKLHEYVNKEMKTTGCCRT